MLLNKLNKIQKSVSRSSDVQDIEDMDAQSNIATNGKAILIDISVLKFIAMYKDLTNNTSTTLNTNYFQLPQILNVITLLICYLQKPRMKV